MILNRIITLLVSLCVLATSGAAATSQLDRGAGAFMTICSDGQVRVVEVGRDGSPIEPIHHCPDCLAITGVLLNGSPLAAVEYLKGTLEAASYRPSQSDRSPLNVSARSPPFKVS